MASILNNKMNGKPLKSLNMESKIVEYLERYGVAGEDEIVQALNLDIITVLDELLELEKKGVTIRVNEVELLGN